MSMDLSIDKKKIGFFVLFTYLFSFIFLIIARVAFNQGSLVLYWVFVLLYSYTPMTVAFIMQKLVHKESIKPMLAFSFHFNKWFLIGWLFPLAFFWLSIGIGLIFPDTVYNSAVPTGRLFIYLLEAMVAGLSLNALLALGSEIGWRGFLMQQLQKLHFFRKTLYIGLIWGIWLVPYVMDAAMNLFFVFKALLIILYAILSSFFLNYIRLKSESIIAVAIMSGTLSVLSVFDGVIYYFSNPFTSGLFGIAGIISFAVFAIALMIYDRYFAKEKVIFVGCGCGKNG